MKNWQKKTYELIRDDDENGMAANLFDGIIIALIFISTVQVVLDTFTLPAAAVRISRWVEVVLVAVFTAEYALRLWTAPLADPARTPLHARLRYLVRPMAVIDLLAILPFYLPFVFPIDLRVLRALRMVRLFRLLKINRYTTALGSIGKVLRRKASQLISSVFVVLLLMLVSAVLMYHIENAAQPDKFANALDALWWAVATFTTVGYGDLYPITAAGRLLSAVIALLGIGLVAVPTGIISSGFIEQMNEDAPAPKAAYCPHCGRRLWP